MRHRDRFRNWLGDIYDACLRFRSHFGADNSGGADEPTVEKQQRHEIAADVTQLESVSTAPKQASNQQTETIPQQKRVAIQPPAVTEHQRPASQKSPESSRQAEVKVVAREPVTSTPEPHQAVLPAQDRQTVPQNPIVKPPSAISPSIQAPETTSKRSKLQADENGTRKSDIAQTVKSIKAEVPKRQLKDNLVAIAEVEEGVASAGLEQERTNGSGSAIRSARDKYSPGAITDQTAQRLARLLISEIKLYNKVADSTANNVYDILRDPIDKARKYYCQRLGTTAIASMPDYFHAELVRTLCAGDASRLGPNYKS